MLVPIDWQFRGDPWGRPEIALLAYENVGFNLSNIKELAAGAVALEGGIGVDVETLDRAGDLLEFASGFRIAVGMRITAHPYRNSASWQNLKWQRSEPCCPMSMRTAAIYSTLKEAYIKARRMGLPIPLNKFRFQKDRESPAPPPIRLVLGLGMDDDVVAWSFAYFQSTSTFGRWHADSRPRPAQVSIFKSSELCSPAVAYINPLVNI
jgi:4'-phosphopantetheinyl transferase